MQINKENINLPALRAGIKDLETQIREAKKQLRSTWTEPMDSVQRKHIQLRHEVTAHLILRAGMRGRIHTTHRDENWIENWVTPLLTKYAKPATLSEPESEPVENTGVIKRLWNRISGQHAVG